MRFSVYSCCVVVHSCCLVLCCVVLVLCCVLSCCVMLLLVQFSRPDRSQMSFKIGIPEKSDPEPRTRDPGPLCGTQDSRPFTWDPGPGPTCRIRHPGPETFHLGLFTWGPGPKTLHLEPETRDLGPSTQVSSPGTRDLGPYMWEPVSNNFTWNAGPILRNPYINTTFS